MDQGSFSLTKLQMLLRSCRAKWIDTAVPMEGLKKAEDYFETAEGGEHQGNMTRDRERFQVALKHRKLAPHKKKTIKGKVRFPCDESIDLKTIHVSR